MSYSIYENRIPVGWHFSAVKDVCELNPTQINKDYPYATIRYIDISSVGTRQLNAVSTLPLMSAPSRAKRIVQNGDTIISTVRPNRKSFIYIKEMVPNTVVSTGFAVVRPRYIDSRYCHYVITSDTFIDYLTINTSGSAYPAVNPNIIAKAFIPVPPKIEQERIASILGALDDKIELNRQMNRTLESIAQAIFKSWFVDFDPVRAKMDGREPEGLAPEIAALFPDRFQDSELGLIPEGWRVGILDNLVECVIEKVEPTPEKDQEKYVGLDDMPSKSIDIGQYRAGTEVNSSMIRFKKNDILFGNMRPYFHKVGLAQFDGITRTTSFVLRPIKRNLKSFTLLHLFSIDAINYATNSSVGTTIPYIRWDALRKYGLTVPKNDLLSAFENLIEPLTSLITVNSTECLTLATIRDTLLPKLISGQIRIKDAEKFVEAKL